MPRFRLFNVVEQKGIGKASNKPFHFLMAQGVIETDKGPQMVELMLDKEHPKLDTGEMYEVKMDFYPDREKKLVVRVTGLVPLKAPARAAA